MAQFLFQPSGGLGPASQAEQETGTSNQVAVTPGVAQYHPSAAKAWVQLSTTGGTPSLITGYNVSSITDLGLGQFGVNFGVSFSSNNYGFGGMGTTVNAVETIQPFNGYTGAIVNTGGRFNLQTLNQSGLARDATYPISACFYGDL